MSSDKEEAAKGLRSSGASEVTATSTGTDHLVRAVNVTKSFGTNEVLQGHRPHRRRRGGRVPARPQRIGQDHVPALINQMEILTAEGSGSAAS